MNATRLLLLLSVAALLMVSGVAAQGLQSIYAITDATSCQAQSCKLAGSAQTSSGAIPPFTCPSGTQSYNYNCKLAIAGTYTGQCVCEQTSCSASLPSGCGGTSPPPSTTYGEGEFSTSSVDPVPAGQTSYKTGQSVTARGRYRATQSGYAIIGAWVSYVSPPNLQATAIIPTSIGPTSYCGGQKANLPGTFYEASARAYLVAGTDYDFTSIVTIPSSGQYVVGVMAYKDCGQSPMDSVVVKTVQVTDSGSITNLCNGKPLVRCSVDSGKVEGCNIDTGNYAAVQTCTEGKVCQVNGNQGSCVTPNACVGDEQACITVDGKSAVAICNPTTSTYSTNVCNSGYSCQASSVTSASCVPCTGTACSQDTVQNPSSPYSVLCADSVPNSGFLGKCGPSWDALAGTYECRTSVTGAGALSQGACAPDKCMVQQLVGTSTKTALDQCASAGDEIEQGTPTDVYALCSKFATGTSINSCELGSCSSGELQVRTGMTLEACNDLKASYGVCEEGSSGFKENERFFTKEIGR